MGEAEATFRVIHFLCDLFIVSPTVGVSYFLCHLLYVSVIPMSLLSASRTSCVAYFMCPLICLEHTLYATIFVSTIFASLTSRVTYCLYRLFAG